MERENRKEILSVSALNDRIKTLLEERFAYLWVEGEVSNLRRPASGHVYFTLKDAKSQIRAVIFRTPYSYRNGARSSDLALEEGMSILCRGRLSVYPPRGDYQLLVDGVEPRGLGGLQKAFEELKARLDAEGLFDPARKKPLPFLPTRIGVVTSPTGAVIRDILTVTRRRFSSVDILIAPVRVQGPEAPGEIIQALADLQFAPSVEVIILARGGGSLEDLAAFNDEGVARAIAGSRIPVISAVGHETDFTIADFVADLRAATPSAAAELAVPHRAELRDHVEALHLGLIRRERLERERFRQRVAELTQRLRDPQRRLADLRLALDDQWERLRSAGDRLRADRRRQWHTSVLRLDHQNPRVKLADRRRQLEQLAKGLCTFRERQDEQRRHRWLKAAGVLDSLSPLAVLNRGYSIIRRLSDGLIVRQAASVASGDALSCRLAAGSLIVSVMEIQEKPKEDRHVEREV